MTEGAKRAALYVRVSTDEQAAEGYSLDAQRSILEDHCLADGLDVFRVYEDDGYSGRNMMDTLNKKGKEFVSCFEALDTSNALGRFVVDMIQRMAQLESEQIGERTYIGMREKAETLEDSDTPKKTMGMAPPYGYQLEHGSLSGVPEELETVSYIFRAYADGETMDSICYSLNREGTLTRRGNPWNKYNLRNILHNPVYAGYMRWEDILIRHSADTAVSPEDFNGVQELMASKVRDPAKRTVRKVPTVDDF